MNAELKRELQNIEVTLSGCTIQLEMQASPDAFAPAKVIDLLVLNNIVKELVLLLLTKE